MKDHRSHRPTHPEGLRAIFANTLSPSIQKKRSVGIVIGKRPPRARRHLEERTPKSRCSGPAEISGCRSGSPIGLRAQSPGSIAGSRVDRTCRSAVQRQTREAGRRSCELRADSVYRGNGSAAEQGGQSLSSRYTIRKTHATRLAPRSWKPTIQERIRRCIMK